MTLMKLSDFDYSLPKELIAQYPLKDRDQARLMVVHRDASLIEHRVFKDISEYFSKNDLLVLNNTKVDNCRLIGRRSTGGKVELLLLNLKQGLTFHSLLKPARLKLNEIIRFDHDGIYCEITGRNEVTFHAPDVDAVYVLGKTPLPPYIKREPEDLDREYYQTVYAKHPGSVASPTAGLHFTHGLLDTLFASGVAIAQVTLHVGYATFKPVKAEDVISHPMDKEYFLIPDDTIKALDEAKSAGGRVCAAGTTSCRVLETYARGATQGYTDLFIYPGYEFKTVGRLLTNFHLPRTTLFMLVCAFAGEGLAKEAYRKAIDEKYRFYSYGDAMLIV